MYVYRCLDQKISKPSLLMELINAIGILENLNWKRSYQLYIDVLKTYTNGPSDDIKNVRMILKESGYSPLFDMRKFNGQALIRRGNHFYALIKKGDILYQYGVIDPSGIEEYEEYDMYIKDYKYSYKKVQKKEHELISDSSSFSYGNLNPNNKYVGDCSIRALAYALNTTWYEAVDILAKEALRLHQVYINHEDVVENVLTSLGFTKHKYFPTRLTCSQFCQKMDAMYEEAQILVYAGTSHIVALTKENGRFVLMDTWDSSNELAGCYFTRIKDKQKLNHHSLEEAILLHPTFGEGIVESQEDQMVTVMFNSGSKRMLISWVLEHCEILE